MPKRNTVNKNMHFDIVVMGDGGTGKSCMCLRYLRGKFSEDWDPTIMDQYHASKMIDGRICMLDITDTAGQEEVRNAMRTEFMSSGECFVLVYSAVHRSTFDAIRDFIAEILEEKETEDAPVVLFGNKYDLAPVEALSDNPEEYGAIGQEFVTKAEAQELCDEFGLGPVICGSAKANTNVAEIFEAAVRKIQSTRGDDGDADENDNAGSWCWLL